MPYPNNEHLQCLSTLVDTNANATRKKASVSRPSSSLASAFVSNISSSASKTSELQRSFQACTRKTSFIVPPSASASSTARPTTPPPSAASSSSSPPLSLDILDPINNENADDDFDAGEIR